MQIDEDTQLRLIEERYAEEIFALIERNRSYLRAWIGWVDFETSVESTRDFLHKRLIQFANNQGFNMGIWYQGQLVGAIGFNYINWGIRKGEIGYWLDEAAQGKGIMTRACKAMMALGFVEYHLNKIEIHCAVGNRPSRAIPERLGFTQEGLLRDNEWLYDHYVDHAIYGMLASDWQE
jgi:ribosomal-protein-serine acetyltransferase